MSQNTLFLKCWRIKHHLQQENHGFCRLGNKTHFSEGFWKVSAITCEHKVFHQLHNRLLTQKKLKHFLIKEVIELSSPVSADDVVSPFSVLPKKEPGICRVNFDLILLNEAVSFHKCKMNEDKCMMWDDVRWMYDDLWICDSSYKNGCYITSVDLILIDAFHFILFPSHL